MAAKSSFKMVTFPNVRVAGSNAKKFTEGSRVDVRFYNAYFELVNASYVREFCRPLAINTSEDGKVVQVETHDGFALAFFVDYHCQSGLSNEFDLLLMCVVN